MTKVLCKKRGFTLIELIIGITIFVTGVVAIFTLSIVSLRMNQDTVLRVQALELSREGLEIVRNIRDSNWKNNYSYRLGEQLWGDTLQGEKTIIVSPSLSTSVPWYIQEVSIQDRESYRIRQKPDEEHILFWHGEGIPTPYYRYLSVAPLDTEGRMNEEAIRVDAIVQWFDQGKEKEVVLSTILTDWKKL